MEKDVEAIATDIVDAAIKVHCALGPGLLESAYQPCHAYDLRKRGRKVSLEVALPLVYEGVKLDVGYRIDTWVDDLIIIENKSVWSMTCLRTILLLNLLRALRRFAVNFELGGYDDLSPAFCQLTHACRRIAPLEQGPRRAAYPY